MSETAPSYGKHQSVLFRECMDALKLGSAQHEKSYFLDLTFGAGGHSFGILEHIPTSYVIAFDQDPEAIENGQKNILEKNISHRIQLVHRNFSEFFDWIKSQGDLKFHGILMDLGVSSHQFDSFERGFSFRGEGRLDMRMNTEASIPTAFDLINSLPENEIADILFHYGEERLSRRIAAKIIENRKIAPIETTKQLEDLVFHCYPVKSRYQKTHPATRTFQALRIAVNRELDVLKDTLQNLSSFLHTDGVLAVISFHSLEDRIVKHSFKDLVDKSENQVRILTKKPIVPMADELDFNPRARSAKLRLLQKTIENYGGFNGFKRKKEIVFPEE